MSIFVRPDSPPPRAPTPDLPPTPLSTPPLHHRSRTSSRSRLLLPPHARYPPVPPGLVGSPLLDKTLHVTRSDNNLYGRRSMQRSSEPPRKVSSSTSPPTTPRSLPLPPTTRHSPKLHHHRSLSIAIPYRSPPPSPTIASPPPPVPPIPAFVLSQDKKPAVQPKLSPVALPDLISPICETAAPRRHQTLPHVAERGKGAAMTCLRFFSIRNASRRDRGSRTTVV